MLSTMDTSTHLTGKSIQVWCICNAKVNGLSNASPDYIVDAWEELKPAILHYSAATETSLIVLQVDYSCIVVVIPDTCGDFVHLGIRSIRLYYSGDSVYRRTESPQGN